MKIKRAFTLLEIMIAIVLLTMASGVVGWKMHAAVKRKQLESQLERLRARFTVTQKLAVAMQADWKGVIKKRGKEWLLETVCEEESSRKLAPLRLDQMEVFFDERQVEELTIDFFASGKVMPEGTFLFKNSGETIRWKTVELFDREEGKKLGPVHPQEIK